MSIFVLVHGAWAGGGVWGRVAKLIRDAGHEVYAPTLTGLGDQRHHLSPAVGLDTHVADVVGILEYEDLGDVILVGHSYGGMVITGVAARAPERLGHLVYLDAFLPNDGQSLLEIAPAEQRERFLSVAKERGEGWRIPAAGPERYGVTEEPDRSWFADRLTPQPLLTFLQSVQGASAAICPRTFIRCTGSPGHALLAERLKLDPAWTVRELHSGHMAMLHVPRETADVLLEVATLTAG